MKRSFFPAFIGLNVHENLMDPTGWGGENTEDRIRNHGSDNLGRRHLENEVITKSR